MRPDLPLPTAHSSAPSTGVTPKGLHKDSPVPNVHSGLPPGHQASFFSACSFFVCVCVTRLCIVTTNPAAEGNGLWNLHWPPQVPWPLAYPLSELPRTMLSFDVGNGLPCLPPSLPPSAKYLNPELTQERDESTVNNEQRIDGR